VSERPRVLLVPSLTELEWKIAPLVAEWGDVATYDAPGVGDEPAVEQLTPAAILDRGLAEVESRGWDRYVVVGDEFGTYVATHLAAARPEAVRGLALGHAGLSLRRDGERAPLNGEVIEAFNRLARVDYRTYARHLTQLTQDAYDDALAEAYVERVPQSVTLAFDGFIGTIAGDSLEPPLRELNAPLLLAKHEGCLAWTDEGYEDVVAAFPGARTFATTQKPSVSPEFAEELREFSRALAF
jgi:pimeloyl-ACP methyl ester carboxylesterase